MKIALSERVETELARHLAIGIEKFGHVVAERTFRRVRRFLFETLAAYPRIGTWLFQSGEATCILRGTGEGVMPRRPRLGPDGEGDSPTA